MHASMIVYTCNKHCYHKLFREVLPVRLQSMHTYIWPIILYNSSNLIWHLGDLALGYIVHHLKIAMHAI